MPVRVVSTRDQQPLTVNALLANPLVVPERILAVTSDQFVMDRILRDAGTPTGGAVQFRVSSPIFADTGTEIVNEGAEIPVATVSRGDIQTKPTQKRGLAVVITREMRDRNALGEVERQIQVVKNTIVRDVDGAFLTTVQSAVTQARTATAAWASVSGATIRRDINAARLLVQQAVLATQANNFFMYQPDSLVINPTTETDLLNSTEFLALIFGQIQPSNIDSLDGRQLLGLNILVTPSMPAGKALVCQSQVIGGYGDEVPLESTELYEHPPAQIWRSDTVRTTVGFVDQPQAGAFINGV